VRRVTDLGVHAPSVRFRFQIITPAATPRMMALEGSGTGLVDGGVTPTAAKDEAKKTPVGLAKPTKGESTCPITSTEPTLLCPAARISSTPIMPMAG
jgi:hypothetical protein